MHDDNPRRRKISDFDLTLFNDVKSDVC